MEHTKIALVGRTNVGKSTFFNKLSQANLAITDDIAGVTRDIKENLIDFYGLKFILYDTPGWDQVKGELQQLMMEELRKIIAKSDVILFMIDGVVGITKEDLQIADIVRKANKKVLILINKSEGMKKVTVDIDEIYRLGLGEYIYVSAYHRVNFELLYDKLSQVVVDNNQPKVQNNNLKLAIVGRPNAGKSTLFNTILNEDRAIVSNIPGTTRDSITKDIIIDNGIKIHLIDTAGIAKKKNVNEGLDEKSVVQSITAIRRAHVVIVLMDGDLAFQKQDLAIAKIALHEGKALIFAFNKIDRIVETQGMQEIDNYDYDTFESVFKIPIVYISGQSGKNVKKLLDTVLTSYNAWKIQIKTPELNKWLKIAYNKFHPPLLKERKTALKIKYIVQTATQPPTFNLFANSIDIQTSYLRYLKRSLADYFKLYGIIIRFNIKKTNNPYGKNP